MFFKKKAVKPPADLERIEQLLEAQLHTLVFQGTIHDEALIDDLRKHYNVRFKRHINSELDRAIHRGEQGWGTPEGIEE